MTHTGLPCNHSVTPKEGQYKDNTPRPQADMHNKTPKKENSNSDYPRSINVNHPNMMLLHAEQMDQEQCQVL